MSVGPITATDTKQLPVTIGVTNLPQGLTFNSSTGIISGGVASGASAGSPYHVVVTATDGAETVTSTFIWNVTGITIDQLPLRADQVGANVNLAVHAVDATGGTLTYSATGLPAGLSINPAPASSAVRWPTFREIIKLSMPTLLPRPAPITPTWHSSGRSCKPALQIKLPSSISDSKPRSKETIFPIPYTSLARWDCRFPFRPPGCRQDCPWFPPSAAEQHSSALAAIFPRGMPPIHPIRFIFP